MDVHADAQLESGTVSTVGAVGDERLAADHEDLDFTHRPRKHDDEGSDSGDDDAESATSAQVAGNSKGLTAADEEKELPSHACA